MKSKLPSIILLLTVCAAGWFIGERLSPDALGLALGVIFGMMAAVPAALIAISTRRDPPPAQPPAQQPVIIIAAQSQPANQVIEHRHVHVHVGADGKPLLAPPATVQQEAQRLNGIPVQINQTWWNILNPHTREVLLEIHRQPNNRLEMKP